MNNKNNLIFSVVIFLVVIGILVFVTINHNQDINNNIEEKNMIEENKDLKSDALVISILREGEGVEVQAGDLISVNYVGALTNNTIFDSNIDPNFGHAEPFEFILGSGLVIPGWDQGLVGMKVGEVRRLEIGPDLAYGEAGAGGGLIPPQATLIFEVELLEIKK